MWIITLIGLFSGLLSLGNCCPFICYYKSTDKIVDCLQIPHPIPDGSRRLNCTITKYLGNIVIKIGNGETVNRFQPSSLRLTSSNSAKINNLYLNVSIESIDSKSFDGYFKNFNIIFIESVKMVSVDAFSQMTQLQDLEIMNLATSTLPEYLMMNSTNLNRNMYLRLFAICYSCPKLESSISRVYLKVIPNSSGDKSIVYSNINLSKCKEQYVRDICISSSSNMKINGLESSRDSMQLLHWLLIMISCITFVMVIVLLLALVYIKKRYRKDIRAIKSQYITNVLNSEPHENLLNH